MVTRMPSLWHPRLMLDKSSSGYDHNDGIGLMINRIIWRLNKRGVSALRWRCRRADIGTSVTCHDSDQQIERPLVGITPSAQWPDAGAASRIRVGRMPRGRWIQCRLKREDARSTPSAQRLLLSFLLLGLCLVMVSNRGTCRSAQRHVHCLLMARQRPIAAPLAVRPMLGILVIIRRGLRHSGGKRKPTAAQINPRRISPSSCSSQTPTKVASLAARHGCFT